MYLVATKLMFNDTRFHDMGYQNQVTHPYSVFTFFKDSPVPKAWFSRFLQKSFCRRML